MTFALPGVEEREADSDGVCEQLSHLLQAMGYVAGLSKLTVCNALPPSCRLSHLPTLPPPLFLPHSFSLYFFSWPTDCFSHILSAPLCFMLPQSTVYLSPTLCPSLLFFFQCGSLRGEQVGLADGWKWISVVFVNILLYSSMARTFKA